VRRAAETEDQRRHQADDATALVIGLGHGTKLVDNVRKARTMPGNL
jgi:hypothetical protein